MSKQGLLWIVFAGVIGIMLALDLGIFRRKVREVKMKEALIWSAVWIGLAFCFNAVIFFLRGPDTALKFLTGYLLEESLSVDNLFVFLLIFSYFRVEGAYQHRVLFWGILGAVVMRGLFIGAGITMIHRFHGIIYVFGAFLVWTGYKLVTGSERSVDPAKNPLIQGFRRIMPVTEGFEGGRFFTRKNGRIFATPLFIVLMMLETTDVIFAFDSIPAILAVTTDPFVVFTSNIFAILGLRSLYFALANMMQLFYYLSHGLALILILIGIKMLVSDFIHVSTVMTLGALAVILTISVAASLIRIGKTGREPE